MYEFKAAFMDVFNNIISFIPNLIGALLFLLLAWILATIVKNVIVKGLNALGLDNWLVKKGLVDGESNESQGLIKTLGKLAYFLIFLLFLPSVFDALKMESVSAPIKSMMDNILNFAPRVIVAAIILFIGLFIAKMLGTLVKNLLQGFNVGRFNHYVNFGDKKDSIDIPQAIGWTVTTIIGLFFAVQALNTINLTVLNEIGAAIIGYLPLIISSIIILALGIIGGNILSNIIFKSSGNKLFAEIVKYLLIVMSVFMALDQMNFAQSIVNVAFLLILGAVAVAFAIAFGIGGKSFAEKQLNKISNKFDK